MKLIRQADVCSSISVLKRPDKEASSSRTFPFVAAYVSFMLHTRVVALRILRNFVLSGRPAVARRLQWWAASTSATSPFVCFPVIQPSLSFHPAISSERMVPEQPEILVRLPICHFIICLAVHISEHTPSLANKFELLLKKKTYRISFK